MQLTINQQKLVNAYGKKALNKELYSRGAIPKELYYIAAEKITWEIDQLNDLCCSELILHSKVV